MNNPNQSFIILPWLHCRRHAPDTAKPERGASFPSLLAFCLLVLAGWLAGPGIASAQVPVILAGPTNQVVAIGGTVTLNVTADGGPLPACQWFKDGRRLMGATNATLTVTNAGSTSSGSYYAAVTNASGMVISLPALVAVGNPYLTAWGSDNAGQLGNGTSTSAANPTPFLVMSNVVAGAAGDMYSLFVTASGTLWATGANGYGQLGNGTTVTTKLPVPVASNVVAVAAGYAHSLFVTTNGTLWAMGLNGYGELGNGSTAASSTPVSVASNVVAAAAGNYHSLFVKTDGTLWAMGNNLYGQLGNNATNTGYNPNPIPVFVASNVVAVAAGSSHSLFVKMDGTLWAVGQDSFGQLGAGTTSYTNKPLIVASNVVAVAAGNYHSLFIKTNGTLWAMGNNGNGQLGTDSTSSYSSPVSVASNVVAVAAEVYDSMFVDTNGTLWAMGDNSNGQLGNGTTTEAEIPVAVPHLSVANVLPADQAMHTLAIGRIVATVTLGNLTQAYTGGPINATATTTPAGLTVNVTYNGSSSAPTNVGAYTVTATVSDPIYNGTITETLVITPGGLTNQVAPVGGEVDLDALGVDPALTYQWFKDGHLVLGATNNSLKLKNASLTDSGTYFVVVTNGSGTVISLPISVVVGNPCLLGWGNNGIGQLGNGTTESAAAPATVAGSVVAGAAGLAHSLFVKMDGTLWAMGQNSYGQLGDGTTIGTDLPVNIASNVMAAAAGYDHSLFIKTDGTLWAMGWNVYGQLGNGSTSNQYDTPVSVAGNVVSVAAGQIHSLFLTTDGTLWGMGQNAYGQLGDGLTGSTNLPVSVAGNVVALAAGAYHSLFIKTDGTLWAMGQNLYGQLGNAKNDGNGNANPIPAIVASNVVAVAAGAYHSLFVKNDGTLWAMGLNVCGQLGNGTTNNVTTPVSVASNVVAVAAGYDHSLFVKTDGTLWTMGYNGYGQLGYGTNNTDLPGCVPHLFTASLFPIDLANHSLVSGINYTANSIGLPENVPALTFVGAPSAGYNVERSTDLINWSVIWTTNEPANGVFQFSDPAPPQVQAFYRLQPNP